MPGQLEDTSTSQHLEPRRPEPGRLLLALLVMAAAMLVTAFVGRQVVLASSSIRRSDASVIDATTGYALERPGLVDALLLWAHLTEPWVLFLVLALLAGVLHWRGLVRRRALWVVPVGLVGWGLSITCKYIVGRPRPVPPEAITVADGYSYPSGHATGSTIAMILLVVLLWPLARRTWTRTVLVVAAGTLVVLTCLDRVYLGVHYPTDVVAGVLVGSAMTAAALTIGLRPRPGPTAPPQSNRA
ncbi:phosphatase PAP2 family protein [Janibacter melonis]|uniref:phosphatase PAP2 family protein n=1 Tax=Janibacter melonis TaxID=262209 RepID=UPI001783BA18